MRRLEDSERGRTVRAADELNSELNNGLCPAEKAQRPFHLRVPRELVLRTEGRLSAPVLNWMRLFAGAERYVRGSARSVGLVAVAGGVGL